MTPSSVMNSCTRMLPMIVSLGAVWESRTARTIDRPRPRKSSLCGRGAVGLRLKLLPGLVVDDDDRVDRAVGRRRQDLIAVRPIRVHHDRLVLAVQLEHAGGGVHAVAEAEAQLAIDLDRELVALRQRGAGCGLAHAAATSSSAAAGPAVSALISRSDSWNASRCIRETTSRWIWAVPSKIW